MKYHLEINGFWVLEIFRPMRRWFEFRDYFNPFDLFVCIWDYNLEFCLYKAPNLVGFCPGITFFFAVSTNFACLFPDSSVFIFLKFLHLFKNKQILMVFFHLNRINVFLTFQGPFFKESHRLIVKMTSCFTNSLRKYLVCLHSSGKY